MKTEIFDMLSIWEKEKKIQRPALIEALHKAFLAAGRKAVQRGRKLEVIINEQEKEIKLYATLVVVNKVLNAHDEISIEEARRYNKDIQLGQEIRVEVTPSDLGRIASTIATEAFKRALRQAEKEKVIEQYRPLIGDIVSGKVVGFEQSDIIIDLGDCEGIMPHYERIKLEKFSVNDTIRGVLKSIENRQNTPRLVISRSDPEFVKALFRLEVSEIKEGIIEIKAIARDPGSRTKVAVYSNNPKVDALGACVGLRGDRVKNIVKELGNEKVDVVLWDSDISNFIVNAIVSKRPKSNSLLSEKIKSIDVDKKERRALVVVSRDFYQAAYGRHGQNARLISRLCGYDVNIIAESEPQKSADFEEKMENAIKDLSSIPGVSVEMAKTLVENGVTNLESLLSMDVGDLESIEGIGENAVQILAAAREEAEKRRITLT